MYYEARTDRKLATLSDHEFRVWFNLLCFAAEQDERGIIPESDDYMLGIEVGAVDGPDLRLILDKLERLRIVSRTPDWDAENEGDEDEYGYQFGVVTFIHFDDRNHDKPSDHPDRVNERVKRHRQSKKESETPSNADVTPSNAHVTPKIRVDRDKSREEEIREKNGSLTLTSPNGARETPHYSDQFLTFWNQYPNGHGSKKVAFEVWQRLRPDADLQLDIMASLAKWNASEQWQQGYVKDAERFLRNRMWEVEPPPPKPLAPSRNKAQEQVDMLKRIAMEAQS
jgi:hypothetical protein